MERRAVSQVGEREGRLAVTTVRCSKITQDSFLVKWKDDVNLRGVFVCTRAVVPHMIAGGGGVVLNASSVVGLYGNTGQSNYAATARVLSLDGGMVIGT